VASYACKAGEAGKMGDGNKDAFTAGVTISIQMPLWLVWCPRQQDNKSS